MEKSKKTKIHKKIDGQLLQMNKSFNNVKMKQMNIKISGTKKCNDTKKA